MNLKKHSSSFNKLLKRGASHRDSASNSVFISLPQKAEAPFLLLGDVRSALRAVPDRSISVVVTSPPYWNLRDYKQHGQLGSEAHPQGFVDNIANIATELLRVLKDDGAFFLNIGDTYVNQSLQMIPQKVAIRMQELGWLVRNQVIWHKPNHMPSPVKNRLANTYEIIYFFSKNDWEKRIYFDLDGIRVAHKSSFKEQSPNSEPYRGKFAGETKNTGASPAARLASQGVKYTVKRNIEAPQAEVAGYLRRALGRSGTSLAELTDKLGRNNYKHKTSHWFRTDAGGSYPSKEDWAKLKSILRFDNTYDLQMTKEYKVLQSVRSHPKGKNPGDLFVANTAKSKHKHFAVFPEAIPELAIKACCPENGIVLDPFAGSGTTGVVAARLKRRCLMIDIQPQFARIIKERLPGVKIVG